MKDNWLQIDIGHPTRVTALVTKGRGDRGEQWVTTYVFAFSNDTRLWVYYNDAQRTETKVSRWQRGSMHHPHPPQIGIQWKLRQVARTYPLFESTVHGEIRSIFSERME